MARSIGENTAMISDSAVDLGITRAGRKKVTINVKEIVSVARRICYSLMNTGLHGVSVSHQIYKVCVNPRLL